MVTVSRSPSEPGAALPPPDASARAHSARLMSELRRELGRGSIGFERFMHHALYAPGLGYYMAGQARFGVAGDFVTAPETSPLFAGALAAPLAAVLQQLGGGDVLELGGGSGALAHDLLCALATREALPRHYSLLEVSPALRRQQQRRLASLPPELAARVRWLETLPQDFSGVILANEVADALPVARFCVERGALHELRTALRDGRLVDTAAAPGEWLRERLAQLREDCGHGWPDGYRSEVSPALVPWVHALAGMLRRGLLLIIDYGYGRRDYYHPQRLRGTLVCHYRHRVHDDPYWYPGLQDISASVDFTTVAEAGAHRGLELEGYTAQAGFLIDAGILSHARGAVPGHRAAVAGSSGLQRLLAPDEMGERFKVIGLSRGLCQALPGFRGAQQTHGL